ncbi:MAG: GNAT family N-acetyltransferase [Thermomicrobiales bacterium]
MVMAQTTALPCALGDNLVLRRATPADADALATFNGQMHAWPNPSDFNDSIAVWTRDLLRGNHPTTGPDDILVVEDTAVDKIAATTCLISQTWSYGGVPFKVGRPELVATDPAYRRRGLIRRQFDVLHAWSAERGELAQAITGIPWYYRQFGYEMTVELDGGRAGDEAALPKLGADDAERFRLREATAADLPFIASADAHGAARGPLACVRDDAAWQYQLDGRTAGSAYWRVLRVIERQDETPIGFLSHSGTIWGQGIWADRYELAPGVSWLDVTPAVIRYLWAAGQEYAMQSGKLCLRYGFAFGSSHPVYDACAKALPITQRPYAWFLRVPDIPAFLRHVTPALEERLARSLLAGHTGTLSLNFYRTGVRLNFEGGRLTAVEAWTPSTDERGDAAFPELTFLHILFGHRSLDEVRRFYPDCWTEGQQLLVETLFPPCPSSVWALG